MSFLRLAACAALLLLAACAQSTAPVVAQPVETPEQPATGEPLPPVMRCAPAAGSQQVAKSCDDGKVRS